MVTSLVIIGGVFHGFLDLDLGFADKENEVEARVCGGHSDEHMKPLYMSP